MKRIFLISALAPMGLLAACGQKADNTGPAAANASSDAAGATEAMTGNMAMPAEPAAKMARGTGTVKIIDKAAGTITLEHGPIAEVHWPAMTMAFKAAPALIDSVKVGDKVAFDVTITGNAGEVTAIQKQ